MKGQFVSEASLHKTLERRPTSGEYNANISDAMILLEVLYLTPAA